MRSLLYQKHVQNRSSRRVIRNERHFSPPMGKIGNSRIGLLATFQDDSKLSDCAFRLAIKQNPEELCMRDSDLGVRSLR